MKFQNLIEKLFHSLPIKKNVPSLKSYIKFMRHSSRVERQKAVNFYLRALMISDFFSFFEVITFVFRGSVSEIFIENRFLEQKILSS